MPVAAAFQADLPAPSRKAAVRVPHGGGGREPPARRGRVRLIGAGRAQKEQKRLGPFRREVQAPACLEIDPRADPAGDDGRRTQPQSFLDGPQGLLIGGRFDQDEPFGVDVEIAQAMTVRSAEIGQAAVRDDEKARSDTLGQRTPDERGDEAESGRHVVSGHGCELVQDPGGEAAAGEMVVDRRKQKGKDSLALSPLRAGKQLPQPLDDLIAVQARIDTLYEKVHTGSLWRFMRLRKWLTAWGQPVGKP